VALLLGLGAMQAPPAQAEVDGFLGAWSLPSGHGDGQFYYPWDIFTDPSGGVVYVVDRGNDRVQKFTSTGGFLGAFGGGFDHPTDGATDAQGNVYITDSHRVQVFSADGTLLRTIGCWCYDGTQPGQFWLPESVDVDPAGNVYVADSTRIQKFGPAGNFLFEFGRPTGTELSGANLAIDPAGNLYVAKPYASRIEKYDGAGRLLAQWGSPGKGDGQFESPASIEIGLGGAVYVADSVAGRVQKFDPSGGFLGKWGARGFAEDDFQIPVGLATDPAGNVYVLDSYYENQRIRIVKFGPDARDRVKPVCSNGVDDDLDSKADARDPGCTSDQDMDERNASFNVTCGKARTAWYRAPLDAGRTFVDKGDRTCVALLSNEVTMELLRLARRTGASLSDVFASQIGRFLATEGTALAAEVALKKAGKSLLASVFPELRRQIRFYSALNLVVRVSAYNALLMRAAWDLSMIVNRRSCSAFAFTVEKGRINALAQVAYNPRALKDVRKDGFLTRARFLEKVVKRFRPDGYRLREANLECGRGGESLLATRGTDVGKLFSSYRSFGG
jgi:DNA-binding beta-propeller fold protein YncE